MSDTESTGQTKLPPMQLLRQRRGGVPKELMECSREQARMRQKICGVLKRGPMTVPEIHEATGIPADRVLWFLMAWKKYGKILEGGQCGDYYQYALAKEDKK
jgi:hypothetical protein